jgi:hypothetical protein
MPAPVDETVTEFAPPEPEPVVPMPPLLEPVAEVALGFAPPTPFESTPGFDDSLWQAFSVATKPIGRAMSEAVDRCMVRS